MGKRGFIQSPQDRLGGVHLDHTSCLQQRPVWQDYSLSFKERSHFGEKEGSSLP